MFYKDPFVIAPNTFKLIQELQQLSCLKDFNLVGGTSLALQLGHRNSIDIDLFTENTFTVESILETLQESHSVTITLAKTNVVLAIINNVKTDFIRHNYPLLKPPIVEEGVRMLGLEDIAAMKLHYIVQSGKRLKDFIDVYFLLEHYSMSQIVGFYEQKYSYYNAIIALKALNYFEDIDEAMDPPKMNKPISLTQIKKRIQTAIVRQFITF